MTDTQEAPAGEPTIEERAAEFLDQLSDDADGGPVRWSVTTLPAILRAVLPDLDHHYRKPRPAMPQLHRPEPSAEAVRRRKLIREEEQRHTWTGDELLEAIREGNS